MTIATRLSLTFLLSIVFIESATCGERIVIRQSVNHYDLPESIGYFNLSPMAQSAGGYEIKIRTPIGAIPDTQSPILNEYQGNPGIGVMVGVLNTLDLGILFEQANDVGLIRVIDGKNTKYKIKYQFFGPTIDAATQGDFSLAVSAAIGHSTDEAVRNRPDSSTRQNYDVYSQDAALLGGIRLTDHTLLYGGPFMTYSTFKSRYRYNDDAGQAIKYTDKGNGATLGNHLGLAFFIGSGWDFRGEIASSRTRLEKTHQRGTQVGIRLTRVFHLGRREP